MGGVAQQRQIPKFASKTFKSWYKSQKQKPEGKPKVILWADTFNNNFMPPTLKAAYEVLTAAGFEVIVPKKSLCCGRPLVRFWLD